MYYESLMQAAKILAEKEISLSAEDGLRVLGPAWRMVLHAKEYLLKQADEELRGIDAEEVQE